MTITLKRTVFGDAVCRVINVISFSRNHSERGNRPNAMTLNTARAQTAYIQGNGPKTTQDKFRGAMGRLELSKLTVFWKIIDSYSGELLSDSSVRIPFAGLENPAWAGWSHNVR